MSIGNLQYTHGGLTYGSDDPDSFSLNYGSVSLGIAYYLRK